jgi:DNA-binding CsgD family transcriptional regulator
MLSLLLHLPVDIQLDRVQAARRLLGEIDRPTLETARLRAWCATALLGVDSIAEADAITEAVLDEAAAIGDPTGRLWAAEARACVLARRGDVVDALRLFQVALELAGGRVNSIVNVCGDLGELARILGLDATMARRCLLVHAAGSPVADLSSARLRPDGWSQALDFAGITVATIEAARTEGLTQERAGRDAAFMMRAVGARLDDLSLARVEHRLDGLSSREQEVLALAAAGLKDKEIAAGLTIGVRTVNTYMANVLRKLGVANRWAAIDRYRNTITTNA